MKSLAITPTKLKIPIAIFTAFVAGALIATLAHSTPAPRVIHIDADKVQIEHRYDYSRLTLSTCRTDYECEMAEILDAYHSGALARLPAPPIPADDIVDSYQPHDLPVIEPLECLPEDKQCHADNQRAGQVAFALAPSTGTNK